ncbi:Signal peptidase I T,signal peptidase I,signal peptidase I,Peptidase S24-like [Chlamydia poikilotherma]|uniref:Signal peptidase I n=1 Tax=Chlamydia poikilotherma TaxID=1967783 RepID=A0A3B0PMX4_9CHLA|nr:signal peptidase I [Chlamydia poikilotherma]SYX09129.1 Signal peptidase I T,signal peptidase I,signal peptidase I,Peptidase S24-like [Chlamydia poikilotherma]
MRHRYSLNKSRQILHSTYKLLKSKKLSQHPDSQKELQTLLEQLEEAILQQDQQTAGQLAEQAQKFSKRYPASFAKKSWELTKAILFAAVVAFLIRQFWFELYEVPTGSMRPTILEQDRMIVSKTTFGLHFPFKKQPWGFRSEAITRGGLVVFTVGDLPIPNSDTKYFGFIPGKKRYIKRCMGKPGDTLYFYGGKIYGIDKDGGVIHFPNDFGLENLYHVPYISFDGSVEISNNDKTTALFKQMNQPCGKISLPQEGPYGKFFHNGSWHNDIPNTLKTPHTSPVSYSDLFGMGNYAMVRILTHKQASLCHTIPNPIAQTYLEICHTPNVSYPTPHLQHYNNQIIPTIQPMKTLLPLRQEHIHLIRNNLNTSRFVISDGVAYKYQPFARGSEDRAKLFALPFPGVDNGCYEYSKGEAYKIGFGGMRYKLKPTHALMQLNDSQVIDLFNCGINFSSFFIPKNPKYNPLPSRYAFYNQGNLYVMDSPIFIKNDPALQKFIESEKAKQEASSEDRPYIGFIDRGPPPQDLEQFSTFIHNFGIQIPEGYVLVLGDNYPMSADSREFGFVPIENLLGSPLWIFWPLGHFGHLKNVPAPTTLPGYLVNSLALGFFVYIFGHMYYQRHRRLFPKNDKKK